MIDMLNNPNESPDNCPKRKKAILGGYISYDPIYRALEITKL